jgi:hypothetical protein
VKRKGGKSVGAPKLNHAAIDRTIRRHWSKLRKKGVLAVAIVDKKKKHVPPKDLLPTRIGDKRRSMCRR